MEVSPRSLGPDAPFPYRDEIVRAIDEGASVRKDERQLRAGELVGTYQIRLNIALDPGIDGGLDPGANVLARDLKTIVQNLSVPPETLITVYYIRVAEHTLYYLFEYAESGGYVGCLRVRKGAQ